MSASWFDSVTITVECAFATAPFAVTPTWTDISAYVRNIDLTQGGRATGLDQFAPGSLRLELDNSDRRFDPLYSSGAYYPNVLPRKKIRVRAVYSAVTYDLWCGYVDGWPTTGEPSNRLGICTVSATDGFKMLSRNRLPNDSSVVGEGERADVRIGRLLDDAGWPAADRTLDTDSPVLVRLTQSGQTIMSELYQAANGDLGEIFITPDGKFVYRGHRWQLANNLTASATFSDQTTTSYTAVTMTYDDTEIFNRALGQAWVGWPIVQVAAAYEASDATSITAYGESARDIGTVGISNGYVLTNTLNWILAAYKDATLRVTSMTVNPRSTPATLYPVVLAAQVGTRWTFVRHPQNVGSAISQDVIVQSVSHRIGLDTWESTFLLKLAPATPAGNPYWRMGVSLWNSTTVWA
jgi:hypothetical protein